MKVKICGIQTVEDAQYAEANGADFIGLVFAPSKRRISSTKAAKVVGSIKGEAKIVGVFVNETVENIIQIAKTIQLDYVQLHGDEPAALAKKLPYPVIKAFSVETADADVIRDYPCTYVLIDSPPTTYEGGSGKTFDWQQLNDLSLGRQKLILAGGLTPENVSQAIQSTQPVGVDVSSGVETNSQKDQSKIKQFIHQTKGKVTQQ